MMMRRVLSGALRTPPKYTMDYIRHTSSEVITSLAHKLDHIKCSELPSEKTIRLHIRLRFGSEGDTRTKPRWSLVRD